MTEWGVVGILAALISLGAGYYNFAVKPRIEKETKLTETISAFVDELHNLTIEVKHLSENISKTENKVEKHGERLDNHENRLTKLEVKGESK